MHYEKKHRLPLAHYRGLVAVSFTSRILEGGRPFLLEAITGHFQGVLRQSARKHGCDVPVWCFMPDHIHVILGGTRDDSDTWKAMVAFKHSTGFWFGRNGPEFGWQRDFHDHVIRTEES